MLVTIEIIFLRYIELAKSFVYIVVESHTAITALIRMICANKTIKLLMSTHCI